MIRSRLFRLALSAFDVLLIAGVALAPILAWRGIRLVEFGILPLLLLPWLWRRMSLDRNDWLVIGLFAQYALLVTLNVAAYPTLPGVDTELAETAALYLGAAVGLVLLVLRFRIAIDVAAVWRVVGPAAVIGSVALLGWDHMTSPPPDNCRVGFLSKHIYIPPLWLTVFAVASYHGWDRMAPWERWLRHLTLGVLVVGTVAFVGGRAMVATQAITIPILALLLGRGEPLGRRLRIVALLGVVAFAAFVAGLALNARAGCDFADRLVAIVHTIERAEEADELAVRAYSDDFETAPDVTGAEEPAAPPAGGTANAEAPQEPPARLAAEDRLVGAVYIRPLLWRIAMERIREAPLLGHGYSNEEALIGADLSHFHQQYLSWLVWGGPLMLISGLVMLFAPLVTFGVRQSRDGAILALAMIAPLGLSFLAATNLLHTVMVMGYAMSLALLHALARQERRAEQAAQSGTGG